MCFAILEGSFNREGVLLMTASIQQAWQEAGQPARWAHVMDLHQWQGGTESGFAASHDLLAWAVANGAKAIIRIHAVEFLARVTENQGVFDGINVPIITIHTCDEAWQWLEAQGFDCESCKTPIAPHSASAD
ncbi:hypothetical protein [Viridibacterium curvum]|uniref:hypothetical protein n=1 Tax=Viridibacterium curvum TaxID=1101404 RepID=UPI0031EE37AF